jgi:hypothetical protein
MTSAPDLSVLDSLDQQDRAQRLQAMTQAMPLPQPTPPGWRQRGNISLSTLAIRSAGIHEIPSKSCKSSHV